MEDGLAADGGLLQLMKPRACYWPTLFTSPLIACTACRWAPHANGIGEARGAHLEDGSARDGGGWVGVLIGRNVSHAGLVTSREDVARCVLLGHSI